ncbi:PASTA domain-containing protein [Silvibacterium sp.]|uniref:PASTA domain-containing protein n=1 Tax=Silvibacterium sp. TaxID=1964179 RepID=UPI0039E2D21E
MLRAFQFVLVLLMLAAVALISAVVTMHFAIHGAEVSVPDFKDMTVNEATSRAAALGLNIDVDAHSYSLDIPVGHVDGQTPRAGTVVRKDWHVRLVESLGPQKVAIPNLVGSDARVAAIQIRRMGLELGEQAEMPDAYTTEGYVVAQTPLPNASGVERPTVSLLTAAAPQQDNGGYVMPNFIGQSYTSAALEITHAGLTLAPMRTQTTPGAGTAPQSSSGQPAVTVNVAPSLTAAAAPGSVTASGPAIGTVTAQLPAAGSRVEAGGFVTLTVAE